MTFLASDMTHMSVGNSAIVALLGYAMVFFGISLLMCVVYAMGAIFIAKERKAKKNAPAPAAAPAAPAAPAPVAPGTAGDLKLHGVEPKTAAMLMAIVAEKMGKPLNELRFISIKEVK